MQAQLENISETKRRLIKLQPPLVISLLLNIRTTVDPLIMAFINTILVG